MLPFWRAGCRIHVHSNGDAAQDATAEVLASLLQACPRFDHRFCFEHYGMSNESLNRRLASLGATAAVNPYYPYHRGRINTPFLGKDRALSASALKSIISAGVPVAMHTDTPVAPPRPLEEMWIAVNRKTDQGADFAPAECVSVYEAMRMKTVDAAYVHGLDAVLGSIAPGKFADFAVLSANPLDVPPIELRDIHCWGTVVGGKVFPASEIGPTPRVPLPPKGLFAGIVNLFQSQSKGTPERIFWSMVASIVGS